MTQTKTRSKETRRPNPSKTIRLRGVSVHNLKNVDLDLPYRQLIAFCGVSGSGKTSLALDTLYAEGQRRYIESFSTYTRQFLQQIDKPDAESIDGIPPSIVVSRKSVSRSSRTTVGSATQINEHLQLLFARIGEVVCYDCGKKVAQDSAESAAAMLMSLSDSANTDAGIVMVGFSTERGQDRKSNTWLADLKVLGYRRCLIDGRTLRIDDLDADMLEGCEAVDIVLDRLTVSSTSIQRLRESLETALEAGRGTCLVWSEALIDRDTSGNGRVAETTEACSATTPGSSATGMETIRPSDDCPPTLYRHVFSRHFRCDACDIDYQPPEPQLLNSGSPLGACARCEGFGNIVDIDMDRVVPNVNMSLQDGAIAPWNTPAYAHELEELLALADDYDLPVDVPFCELKSEHVRLINEGVPERDFGGLNGFFNWLERHKYKMHIRVFLSRWRKYYPCDQCHGARLKQVALAVQIAGKNIADIWEMKIADALSWLRDVPLPKWQKEVSRPLIEQVTSRLKYLDDVGVGHLSLGRTQRTLSSGEAQRVALTSALGSNLVGMLYVLDEPSVGLHPADVPRLVKSIHALRDRGNSLAVVEHEPSVIRSADQIVELGPGAGEQGGRVVFQGSLDDLLESSDSRTGDWLAGRHSWGESSKRREASNGVIRMIGARGNNLRDLTVEFPLSVLCLVTGVSGAGKTTLVQQTLFPAVARRLRLDVEKPAPHEDILGVGQIEDAVLIDQSPIGRTPRSNPVTYVKAFDPIRKLFADSPDAQSRGFKASHFSFNVDGGRCEACRGDGFIRVDMRFLADVFMRCAECQGSRYRREVLEVKYRNCNIAEVLELSVREAFTFFRGHRKILSRLKCLLDVGLDYLRLGQPANTLSGGEAQRLKLATYIAAARRGRTLFVLDEPTTGLHFSDVLKLLDCFDSLISMGHSLVVVDHNRLMINSADHIIDIGPGAADEGGSVIAEGTPEQIAENPHSVTGKYVGMWSE